MSLNPTHKNGALMKFKQIIAFLMACAIASVAVQAAALPAATGAGAAAPQSPSLVGAFFRDKESLDEAIRRQNEFPAVCLLIGKRKSTGKSSVGVAVLLEGGTHIVTTAHNLIEDVHEWKLIFHPDVDAVAIALSKERSSLSEQEKQLIRGYYAAPQATIKPGRMWFFPSHLETIKRIGIDVLLLGGKTPADLTCNDVAVAEITWKSHPEKPCGLSVVEEPLYNATEKHDGVDVPSCIGKKGFIPSYAPVGVWGDASQATQRFLGTLKIDSIVHGNLACSDVVITREAHAGILAGTKSLRQLNTEDVLFPSAQEDRLRYVRGNLSCGTPLIAKIKGGNYLAGLHVASGLVSADRPCFSQITMLFSAEHLGWMQDILKGIVAPNWSLDKKL